jgi:hypothetical protein
LVKDVLVNTNGAATAAAGRIVSGRETLTQALKGKTIGYVSTLVT